MKTHEWTPEKIEFIRECMQTMSTRECAKAFTEKYEPLGQTHLRRILQKHDIPVSRGRNDFAPIGTERYSRYYNCMMVKVGDYHGSDNRRNDNWKLKQNVIWEQTAGKQLPWRWCVIFLDGDRMNYDPTNLYAVPLQVAGTVEKMKMHSNDPEIYKTALIWGELYYILKDMNARRE